MQIPAIGDVLQWTLEAEHDNTEDVQQVLQFQCISSTLVTEADWAADMNSLINAIINIARGYSTILTLYRAYRQRNLTQGTPTEHYFMSPILTGTLSGDVLPAGVSPMFVFRTNIPKVTLRKFWGPPSESVNDPGGIWSNSIMTTALADITTLMTPWTFAKSGWQYGHWHAPTASFAVPTSGYMNYEPAYQRRRKRGRGS